MLVGEGVCECISRLEVISRDHFSSWGGYIRLAYGVVVSIAGFIEIEGIIAIDGEGGGELREAVDEVVEEGGSVELGIELCEESVYRVGAWSDLVR